MKSNPYLIAEVGQAHEGSVNLAHNFIENAALNGADAVKFQCHFADHESSQKDFFRVRPNYDAYKSRYDYWKKMEFTPEEWFQLKKQADQLKIDFICSPFSKYAVEVINKIGSKYIKISSGEIENHEILDEIKNTKLKILLSTGLTTIKDLKKSINFFNHNRILAVMYCVSKYPTQPQDINIDSMLKIKNLLKCPTGLSDHSGTIFPCLIGCAYGGRFFEVHVTFDKRMKTFDSSSSLTFDEFKILKQGLGFVNEMSRSKNSIEQLSSTQLKYKKLFSRNAVLTRDVLKNDILKKNDLKFLKPFIDIGFSNYTQYIGKKFKKNLKKNHYITYGDFK